MWQGFCSEYSLCPIHTADADATKLFCRVGVDGVNTNSQLVGDSFVVSSVSEHTRRQSWPSLQFPVLTNDDIMAPLLKSYKNSRILHYTADSNVYKHAASLCYVISYFYSINCNCKLGHGRRLRSRHRIRRQSSWVSCEFMYTPPRPTRRNSTVSSRRRRRYVLGLTVQTQPRNVLTFHTSAQRCVSRICCSVVCSQCWSVYVSCSSPGEHGRRSSVHGVVWNSAVQQTFSPSHQSVSDDSRPAGHCAAQDRSSGLCSTPVFNPRPDRSI